MRKEKININTERDTVKRDIKKNKERKQKDKESTARQRGKMGQEN